MKEYNFIKERREELGLTQRELADKVGIGQSTYSRYENNDFKEIRLCDLEKIIKVLYDEEFDILSHISYSFEGIEDDEETTYDCDGIKVDLIIPDSEEIHKPAFDFRNLIEEEREELKKEVEYHKSLNNGLREENDELCEEVVQLQKDKLELKKIIGQLTNIF